MTTTHIACLIRTQTNDGSCSIPPSAWLGLARALRDKFNAKMHVHDGSCAESDRDLPPHYLVEVILQGASDPKVLLPIVQYLEPQLDQLVEKYTTPHIPLAR